MRVDEGLRAPAGAVNAVLERAIAAALTVRREDAALLGSRFSWQRATGQFLTTIQSALEAAESPRRAAA